ncbi:MAG: ABC transporter permease [Actinobacteria bacterium]|nr:ABC transporter permease [Chloroflexota bacterium]MBE3129040.1 ABC transporter permease [Actinomycetota bacterium]
MDSNISNSSQIENYYEPNKDLKKGFFSMWVIMSKDLFKSAGLGWRLFLRDFSAKYRQSSLGYLWTIIIPLVTALTFIILNKSHILNIGDIDIPYPVFALFGVTVWGIIQEMVIGISAVLDSSVGLIRKINFSKISLVFSPVLITLVSFFIKIILIIIICIIYKVIPSIYMLYSPLILLPIIFISIGLGFYFSIIGAIFKDISNYLLMIFQILMLLTPVLYSTPNISFFKIINKFNPFFYLIYTLRDVVFTGEFLYRTGFYISIAVSVIILLSGWRFYYVATSRIVEKI